MPKCLLAPDTKRPKGQNNFKMSDFCFNKAHFRDLVSDFSTDALAMLSVAIVGDEER